MFQTGGTITKRVMTAIKDRISAAEKEYQDGIEALEKKLIEDKVDLEDSIVKGLLSKLI